MDSDIEFVKMSDKGQLVVPQDIRESIGLNPGERFVAFPIPGGVVFKKVEMPKMDFEILAADIEKQFKKNKIRPTDITQAIKWAKK